MLTKERAEEMSATIRGTDDPRVIIDTLIEGLVEDEDTLAMLTAKALLPPQMFCLLLTAKEQVAVNAIVSAFCLAAVQAQKSKQEAA